VTDGISRGSVFTWRWLLSGMLCHVVWYKLTDVSEVLTASIIRVFSSEMPLNFYQTAWCNIPDDCHLCICCHKNLNPNQLDGSRTGHRSSFAITAHSGHPACNVSHNWAQSTGWPVKRRPSALALVRVLPLPSHCEDALLPPSCILPLLSALSRPPWRLQTASSKVIPPWNS
jgi:hypothetical protein